MPPEVFVTWKLSAEDPKIICGYWIPANNKILDAVYEPERLALQFPRGTFKDAVWTIETSHGMPSIAPTTDTRAVQSLANAFLNGRYLGVVQTQEELAAGAYLLGTDDLCYLPAYPSGFHIWKIRFPPTKGFHARTNS